MKKITSIVLALMMILSVMTVGIVSVDAKPVVPIILDDFPEWEWAITEVSTGNTICLLDETESNAYDPEMLPGYYVSSKMPENIGEIKVELYHMPPIPRQEGDDTPFGVVLSKTVNLADLEAASPYSVSIASYSYGKRDSETKLYIVDSHHLSFNKSGRRFEVNASSGVYSSGTALFINKKFMDDLYRDRIIEECGEPKSFADWVNSQSAETGYSVMLAVSKDGENWLKFAPLNAVKAQIVGENQDTYSLRPGRTFYWDYSVKNLGSCYWMLTDDYSYANNSTAGALIPNSFLAKGTLTCYCYGNEVNYNSTEDELYAAYKNAPDEYKTETLNVREGAIMLNTSANYIIDSNSSEQSIVTLDYDTANLRVTVPTVLPVSVDSDNNVTVSDSAQIVNGSNGQVDVTNAVLSGSNSWTLAAFDTDFKKVPVDTKQYGFKLQGYSVPVSGNAYNNQFDTIDGGAALDLSYDANVAIQSEATKDAEIGNIVFTVAWHK